MKKILNTIKSFLLYSGVEKNEYEKVINSIHVYNRNIVFFFSGVAIFLISGMCFLSIFVEGIRKNIIVYILGLTSSICLFMLCKYFASKRQWIVTPLLYSCISLFCLYGIAIATLTNPEEQTVTFMVFLVFIPVLLTDRPIRVNMAIIFYIIIFIILAKKTKVDPVLSNDISDAIVYGILGCFSGTMINHVKVKGFVLEYKLHMASRIDQLTNINNRNSFENDLESIGSRCTSSLVCLYIDVNGLHELNDTQGHEAGDNMLKCISEKIKKVFGEELSYRIGGDEFSAFMIDSSEEEAILKIQTLKENVEKNHYHIAVGYACSSCESLDMDTLIKTAESGMYKDKSKYYKENNIDRRRNR